MLDKFLAEQREKQAALKKKRVEGRKIQTAEASVQCSGGRISKQLKDVSVQTDHFDFTQELKEQVQKLSAIVMQLTSMKCPRHDRVEKASDSTVLNLDPLDDSPLLDPAITGIIKSFCSSSDPEPQPVSQLPSHVIQSEHLSPVYHRQVSPARTPLATVHPNVQPPRFIRYGPTDEQRRKVECIVDLGKDLTTTALACVDALFTEEEMARGNTSGSKGFEQLDSTKMSYLISVLKKKFDSPSFSEQWSQSLVRINTKCRGKRRTLIQRLKKNI